MSHTIFDIEETLDHVICMASLGSEPDRATLFAAARVNKQWSTIALNYLWADLTLQHLLYFLGYQNRKYPRCKNCGEVLTRQWLVRAKRFNAFYAPRVRHMFLGFKYTDKICEHFIAALSSISLFDMPKLRTLKLNIYPHEQNLALSRKFLVLSLVELNCKICKRVGKVTYPNVKEILEILDMLATAKDIHYFRLRISLPREIPSQAFVDSFQNMTKLAEIDLPPYLLSPTLIAALSTHPTLQRVSCITRPTRGPRGGKFSPCDGSLGIEADRPAPIPADRVSNLTHISICTSLETASGLLAEGFNPHTLVSVSVMLRDLVEPSRVSTFTQQLSRRLPLLQQFRLSAPEFDFTTNHQRAPRMLWDSLRPMLKCAAMQDFEVFWHTVVVISNDDIREIALTWPKLRRLVLEGVDPQSDEEEAMLSLDCLLPLAAHCHSLQQLSIHVSPKLADDADSRLNEVCLFANRNRPAMFPNMRQVVFHLGLPLPPAHEVLRIAELVGEAFPTDCTIRCPHLYKCERVSLESRAWGLRMSPGAEMTNWQKRQLGIAKFWQTVIWTMPEGACRIRLDGDYEPRFS